MSDGRPARRPPAAAEPLPAGRAGGSPERLGRTAIAALYDELALDPKPGLVSFVDSGSHLDMDASTFLRSLSALRGYYRQIARLGALDADFGRLERLGIDAERRMMRATGGVNTHRGAIFSLGLLCAAAGRLAGRGGPLTPPAVRASLLEAWSFELARRCGGDGTSNGQRAARAHGLRSAGEEAARGFPVVFEMALPCLRDALAAGLDARRARLQTLLQLIAVLDDTNLVHRGGPAGLAFARRAATAFLAAGGAFRADAIAQARALHRQFVERRLSPGGAADLLAATCWLQRVCE